MAIYHYFRIGHRKKLRMQGTHILKNEAYGYVRRHDAGCGATRQMDVCPCR
jgi:hypothetical protein